MSIKPQLKQSAVAAMSPGSQEFYLSTALWSRRASPSLRQAAEHCDMAAFGRFWRQQFLLDRPSPAGFPTGLCLWSLFDVSDDDPIIRSARQVFADGKKSNRLGGRGAMKAGHRVSDDVSALTTLLIQDREPWSATNGLIAGELLITFSARLEPVQIWRLWNRLAQESPRIAVSETEETPDQLLLRAGEIPWLAGLLLEPWSGAKRLRNQGRRMLVRELIARTDSDGTPHAELLPRMPLWLAPLIRATLWAERFGETLWSDSDRQRLALLLERAIQLCRADGRLALSNGLAIPVLPLFDAARTTLSLTGPAEALLCSLKAQSGPKVARKRSTGSVETMPSNQSDWSRLAVLRSDWSPQADCLAISHHQPEPLLDVSALGRPIIHGPWGWELQIGDAAIEPAEEWACSCWFSDPDADYLELQMAGPGTLRVERQILLSRKEHFLLLADSVRGAGSVRRDGNGLADHDRIHLRSRLPLASGATAETVSATREIRLKSGRQTIRVFPLGLADDRIQSTPHRCAVDGDRLVLHQIGQGNGLYAPLVFDWHPARTRQPALWRTLTVAEAGQVLPRDQAAGHRLQIGKFQWLIYHSLSPIKTARTVLGHHTWHESVIANFDKHGNVEAIMNVDP